jgi:pyruvate dehydrogenase E2 component (dihydrolipoamide acetyltransferase)
MAIIVRMPEVLANASEAAMQTWLVKVGDTVAVGQPLAEIETEKANVEYQSEVEGTVLRLLVSEGDSAAVGEPIVVIAVPGESDVDVERLLAGAVGDPPSQTEASEDAAPASVAPTSAAAVPSSAAPSSAAPTGGAFGLPQAAIVAAPAESGERMFASPLVRRLARERNLDLATIVGSGPGGRIVRRDLEGVQQAVAPSAPPTAAPPTAAPAPAAPTPASPTLGYTDVPHTGMRRAIARRLTESKSSVPHFYVVADCRVDGLLELRKKVNETAVRKISVNDFVIKAVAKALVEVPAANVIWTDDASRRFDTVDLAVAVSTEGGLLTPVLRGVERLGLAAISEQVSELADRARSGRLKQHELEGGSFAISNLGMFGVDEFSAILNPPQSGILAVAAAKQRPVVENDGLIVGTVMTVTLSADHRVVDGALAATWLAAFVRLIENPLAMLL